MSVSADLKAELLNIALTLPAGVYGDLRSRGDFLEAAEKIGCAFDGSEIGILLQEVKAGNCVVLEIHNLPVDPLLPPAPLDGASPVDKKTFVSEGIAAGLAQKVGFPSLLIGEKKQALVHQITPVPGREHTLSNEGSVDLGFHQDQGPVPDAPQIPYGRFMPDWLILTGVQRGSGVTPTLLASVDEALVHVSSKSQTILCDPRFMTDPPESFLKERDPHAGPLQVPIHPILEHCNGHIESVFDSTSNLRPADPEDTEALQALQEFQSALGKVCREVVIQPGTSVIFNNRRVVHGRGAVQQEQETNRGAKRWLQRMYIFDIARFASNVTKSGMALSAGGGVLQATPISTTPHPKLLALFSEENPPVTSSKSAI